MLEDLFLVADLELFGDLAGTGGQKSRPQIQDEKHIHISFSNYSRIAR